MKNKILINLGILILFVFSFSLLAKQNLNIPEPLMPWKDWVLHGYEQQLCPIPYNNGEAYFCVWPTSLEVVLDEQKAQFKLKSVNYIQGWIPLPGNNENWPQEVKVGEKLTPVGSQEGNPAIFLPPGEYTISGQFF